MIVRYCIILVFALALWAAAGCNTRYSEPDTGLNKPVATNPPPVTPAPGGGPEQPRLPAPRILPDLRSEPLIRVFLAQSAQFEVNLVVPATTNDGRKLAVGRHLVRSAAGALFIDDQSVPSECRLQQTPADRRFGAELISPYGKAQRLEFSGQAILRLQSGQAQLLEEVPLETYLAGVIPTEMSPTWPLEALKAQAIAARSYAAAKYLERFDRPWQLHWHYSVDMAYAGVSAKTTAQVRQALRETRGQLITYHDLPVPALFHACSGGSTEAATNLWPTLLAGDRKTPMTAQMPVVADPSAETGCAGLGLTSTHWRWKANIALSEITQDLQAWARSHPEDKLVFGPVNNVEIATRHPDSGRVATVTISHKIDGRTRRTALPAGDFRMAVDPGQCRSTWWDRCLVVPSKGGTLVLNGRGFGHGVGLSQVSAWQMARSGSPADLIIRRFYPQATLVRRW